MNIPDTLLGEAWYWTAWFVWVGVFALAMWQAPWQRLRDPVILNVWLGMMVLLTVVWALRAGVRPGLEMHFIGATLMTLCVEPWLAFLGLSAVLAGSTLNGAGDWFSYAINALVTIVPAVLTTQVVFRLVDRYLPKNFFVFIFVNGFFGSGLAVFCVGLSSSLLAGIAGIYPADYLFDEYLPYFLLLGFSEAWLTGMVLTLFVVYRPAWVATFDDARYIVHK